MGTPAPQHRMAAINDWVGLKIQSEVRANFTASAAILDVGAGWGKYHFLLPEYVMDACEAWHANIIRNDLLDLYRAVYLKDICELPFAYYDVLIFGDVFEHIQRERAKELLGDIWDRCKQVYIAVPYQYKQGDAENNPYERHLQDDLTPELMASEYPMLKPLEVREDKGVYTK